MARKIPWEIPNVYTVYASEKERNLPNNLVLIFSLFRKTSISISVNFWDIKK